MWIFLEPALQSYYYTHTHTQTSFTEFCVLLFSLYLKLLVFIKKSSMWTNVLLMTSNVQRAFHRWYHKYCQHAHLRMPRHEKTFPSELCWVDAQQPSEERDLTLCFNFPFAHIVNKQERFWRYCPDSQDLLCSHMRNFEGPFSCLIASSMNIRLSITQVWRDSQRMIVLTSCLLQQ